MDDEISVQTEGAGRNHPYRSEDGFVAARRSKITGQHVVMYDGPQAGLRDTGRWVLVCVAHGTVVSPKGTKRTCRAVLDTPSEWCPDCASMLADDSTTFVPLAKVDNITIRKKWAWLVRGDPEKITIFREMYGEDPDRYWQ